MQAFEEPERDDDTSDSSANADEHSDLPH
jgi:hypothetical protein